MAQAMQLSLDFPFRLQEHPVQVGGPDVISRVNGETLVQVRERGWQRGGVEKASQRRGVDGVFPAQMNEFVGAIGEIVGDGKIV